MAGTRRGGQHGRRRSWWPEGRHRARTDPATRWLVPLGVALVIVVVVVVLLVTTDLLTS